MLGGEHLVRKRLTEEDDHGAESRVYRSDDVISNGREQDQFTTITDLPSLVQIIHGG